MSSEPKDNEEESADELLERALELFERAVRKQGQDSSFTDFEKAVLEKGNELQRRVLEKDLQARSDALPVRVDVRQYEYSSMSWEYRRHQTGTGTYFTLCGPVKVKRNRYRRCGTNRAGVVMLEYTEGLVEQMTPALARCVAQGYGNQPVRAVREDLIAAHRCPPSRATMERKAKAIGASVDLRKVWLEAVCRDQETLPEGTTTLVIGLDRTSVPMEEDAPDKAPASRSRPRQRRAPPPIEVNWRMDYAATVSFLDSEGESLARRYFRAPSHGRVEYLAQRVIDEVSHALGREPELRVTVVQDGAMELWRALRAELSSRHIEHTEGLDWYHVAERLSECLELAFPSPDMRRQRREEWTEMMLEKELGADQVLARMKRRACAIDADSASKLREHIRYFVPRLSQMNYASRRAQGLPIGSGVTEGACKSLIGARAKRGGQRWRRKGLGAALSIRAFRQSERFDPMWAAFVQTTRPHGIAAA